MCRAVRNEERSRGWLVRSSAVRCIRKVLIQVSLSAALLATTVPASANNTVGAWSTVHSWPLIAVHAVLMPDGRVLSYGTTASGQQTGNFIYAVWDPSAGLDAGHLTLAQQHGHGHLLQLAGRGAARQPGLHCGRRQLDRRRNEQPGQQQQQHLRLHEQHADPQQRHEPGALVLLVHRAAERRDLHPGRLRRHGPAGNSRHQRRSFGC